MHLTRPKSSKGRSRPTVDSLLLPVGSHIDSKPPECHLRDKPDGSFRSRSEPEIRQARRWNKEELLHLLPQEPASAAAAAAAPLNKYQVLPSIRSRKSEERPVKSLNEKMLQLSLSEEEVTQRRKLQQERTDGQLGMDAVSEPSATKSDSLLLAIRAPCGRRFEQHFGPADTLRAVRASAEARFAANYRKAFIETMDVPRRTFTDMDVTLEKCGILNRSVLCIAQNSDHK